ncbi:CvpA family protein [Marinilactibacillus kalidii]|uniref:CvpA family protein n=1 Tax=Marinilactibacillus kalidii TaxID=2820274 RepID=UPI001ABE9C65|nr:CvpA family protein [Marinilactibacillus kalidii]
MVLTLIIILLLLISLYSGARRGLILQLVLTIGYSISFYFALKYYQEISEYVKLLVPYPSPVSATDNPFVLYGKEIVFNLDQAFYNGVGFVGILLVGWIATRFIGGLLKFITEIPILKQLNAIGGAIIGVLVQYVGIFLILFLLSVVPLDMIQNQFDASPIARKIVSDTPELSRNVYDWWVTEGLEEDIVTE